MADEQVTIRIVTDRRRRRALAFLSAQQIEAVLALPEGARVVGVRDHFTRNGVLVMVEGDMYEPVPEAANPPEIPARVRPAPDRALRAGVLGGGPDFSNVDVYCPEGCAWSQEWSRETTLATIVAAVSLHLAEAHP